MCIAMIEKHKIFKDLKFFNDYDNLNLLQNPKKHMPCEKFMNFKLK